MLYPIRAVFGGGASFNELEAAVVSMKALKKRGVRVIAPPMPAEAVLPWVRSWKGLFALTAAPGMAASAANPEGGGQVVDDLPPPRGLAGD